VKAGQLLAQIDPALYQAALDQAKGQLVKDQAALADARLDLTRYQTLLSQNSIAKQQVDTQAALVKQDEGVVQVDQAQVTTAKVNLDRTRITAPISGRAGVRLIDPGNLIGSNSSATSAATTGTVTGSSASGVTGIVVINQIEPIAVTFTVPQGDFQRLSDLSDGFRRPLAAEALSQETGASLGTGELSIADNKVDSTTGSVALKARFPNADHHLWPGQFVNVRLTLQTLRGAVAIPAVAVNQGPKGPFAYVVAANGKAEVRPLVLGAAEGDLTVIASGLKAGEVVVTDGQMTLKPGATVKPREAAPSQRPTP
jgi:multidrug efflux system membrane fusion protein